MSKQDAIEVDGVVIEPLPNDSPRAATEGLCQTRAW